MRCCRVFGLGLSIRVNNLTFFAFYPDSSNSILFLIFPFFLRSKMLGLVTALCVFFALEWRV